jgi:hypothetical protein
MSELENVDGLTEADLEAEIERVQRELEAEQAADAQNKVATSIDNAISSALAPKPPPSLNGHATRSTTAATSAATASRKRKKTISDDESSDTDSDNDAPTNGAATHALPSSTATSLVQAPLPPHQGAVKKQANGSGFEAAKALGLGINDTIDIDGITDTLLGDEAPTAPATDDELAQAEAALRAEIQLLERDMKYVPPVAQDPKLLEREIKKLGNTSEFTLFCPSLIYWLIDCE